MGSQPPNPGLNLHPLQWKAKSLPLDGEVFTIGPPGKSPCYGNLIPHQGQWGPAGGVVVDELNELTPAFCFRKITAGKDEREKTSLDAWDHPRASVSSRKKEMVT